MTAVVGGLKSLARDWLDAFRAHQTLTKKHEEIESARADAVVRMEHAARILSERVGANVPTRAFHFDDGVLVVDNRGLRFIKYDED